MPSNSINTLVSAQIATAALRETQGQLEVSQRRVATGYRVLNALDDGAVFGIAQATRSQIAGNVSANQDLSNFVAVVAVAAAGATGVSNTLASIRSVLISLADPILTPTQFNQYQVQYVSLLQLVQNYVNSSELQGVNLLSTGNALSVLQDGSGSLLTVTGSVFNMQSALAGVSIAAPASSTQAASILNIGTFSTVLGSVATVLNRVGDLNRQATLQQSFNLSVRDALAVGLGALVDADLDREKATYEALRVRQQLSISAVNITTFGLTRLLNLFQPALDGSSVRALAGRNPVVSGIVSLSSGPSGAVASSAARGRF